MKLKSIKKKIWSIVIIITTLIGILPVQANTTETPVKDVVHIPEHTRSLSGSLLGYKTIP